MSQDDNNNQEKKPGKFSFNSYWIYGSIILGLIVFNLMSVSYTHLRAHETVLDLVCRLLLEKKKNEKQ